MGIETPFNFFFLINELIIDGRKTSIQQAIPAGYRFGVTISSSGSISSNGRLLNKPFPISAQIPIRKHLSNPILDDSPKLAAGGTETQGT